MEKKMKRWIESTIVIILAMILAGCGSKTQRPWGTLKECEQENTQLLAQIKLFESKNTELTEQVNTLSALDAPARLEALETLKQIRIGKRTGFYDKDDDGVQETLVVYLEPLDTAQDYIKAIGKVKIQLWDLDAPSHKAKPAKWILGPDELHPAWGGTIFAGYYRIKIPLQNFSDQKKDYTLKVAFTDYLSGKVLSDQKVITVQ